MIPTLHPSRSLKLIFRVWPSVLACAESCRVGVFAHYVCRREKTVGEYAHATGCQKTRPHLIFLIALLNCAIFIASPIIAAESDARVSYWKDVRPIMVRSCVSCHEPAKLKGKLDLTGHAGLLKGGKGGPGVIVGQPDKSAIIEQTRGEMPEMPEKGEPLAPDEIALIAKWIGQGALNDTPPGASLTAVSPMPTTAPVYRTLPTIAAVAWAGDVIAVAGYHEVLLHRADGSGIEARLPSPSPQITSLTFSRDGRLLLAVGGAPGLFGHVDVWNVDDHQHRLGLDVSGDTLFGGSFSPDATRIGVGCADKTARVIELAGGRETLRLDAHSDWVLGTQFTPDGTRLVTAGRDKNLKLFPVASTKPVEDVLEQQEPLTCVALHPAEGMVTVGGASGTPRVYKVTDLQPRTEQKKDPNLVRSIERQPGPVNALAYSPDGQWLAIASTGEVRIYSWHDGKRLATLSGHQGPVFGAAFSPDGTRICTAGYDGQLRLFDRATQKLIKSWEAVPITRPSAVIAKPF